MFKLFLLLILCVSLSSYCMNDDKKLDPDYTPLKSGKADSSKTDKIKITFGWRMVDLGNSGHILQRLYTSKTVNEDDEEIKKSDNDL